MEEDYRQTDSKVEAGFACFNNRKSRVPEEEERNTPGVNRSDDRAL